MDGCFQLLLGPDEARPEEIYTCSIIEVTYCEDEKPRIQLRPPKKTNMIFPDWVQLERHNLGIRRWRRWGAHSPLTTNDPRDLPSTPRSPSAAAFNNIAHSPTEPFTSSIRRKLSQHVDRGAHWYGQLLARLKLC